MERRTTAYTITRRGQFVACRLKGGNEIGTCRDARATVSLGA